MSIVSKQSEPDVILRPGAPTPVQKDSACISVLRITLADAITLGFLAQGFHWNVSGPDFPQLHDLFGRVYEDTFDSVDPLAENIRKLGGEAPFLLSDFQRLTSIDQVSTPVDAATMVRALLAANRQMITTLNEAFTIATAMNYQGIADFLAGRIDSHHKWEWMLRETAQ